jgi:hypothetical protein
MHAYSKQEQRNVVLAVFTEIRTEKAHPQLGFIRYAALLHCH